MVLASNLVSGILSLMIQTMFFGYVLSTYISPWGKRKRKDRAIAFITFFLVEEAFSSSVSLDWSFVGNSSILVKFEILDSNKGIGVGMGLRKPLYVLKGKKGEGHESNERVLS